MNNEKWVEARNFPNYEVSDLGRIRNAKTEKILKIRQDGKAYNLVSLFQDGKRYCKRLGRLIWQSFNECDCKDTIDHINRIKYDDRLENLRCIPLSENVKRRIGFAKTNVYNITNEMRTIIQMKYDAGEWSTWDITNKYGIPINYVQQVMKRGSWKKYLV